MADLLKIRRTTTPGNEPTDGSLAEGELAVNIPDKKLWVGGTNNNPIEFPLNATAPMGIMEFTYYMKLPPTETPNNRNLSRNNDDPAQATILYVNKLDRYNEDISLFLKEVRAGDWFNIHSKSDTNKYEAYDVIEAPTLNGNIWEIPVSPYANEGTIDDGDRIRLFWRANGIIKDEYREPMGSGVHHGGQITIGAGDLEVNVTAGRGIIVDATTDPFKIGTKDVIWDDQTVEAVPLGAITQEIHMVYVDQDRKINITPVQQITHKLTYDYIRLGWIEISQGVIISVIDAPNIVGQTATNLADLFYSIRDSSKAKGLRIRSCIEGLQVYCESGQLLIPGINWYTDRKNQNLLEIPQAGDPSNPITFSFFNRNAEPVISPQTELPKYYDHNDSYEPLTGGEAVIHYLFWSPGGYSVQIGQTKYTDFSTAYKYATHDLDHFEFAPGANVGGRSILLAQIVISKHAVDFTNKSFADIISLINEESGNTVTPVDMTLVPQYLLQSTAAEDLQAGAELSMDVNGNMQKYPATGGEGQSEFTSDTVSKHAAVYLDNTNNQGIIAWVKNEESGIYFRTAQGNEDGSVTYSPVSSISTPSEPVSIRVCRIDSNRAGIVWCDSEGVRLGIIKKSDMSTAPTIGGTQLLVAVSTATSADCVWDFDNENLIAVYSENGTAVRNRYCKISDNNVESPPYSAIWMLNGDQVRCVTEGGNVIVVTQYDGKSEWREAAWKKPYWSTGRYDDQTDTKEVDHCSKHCGLQVQNGTIMAQFWSNDKLQTYMANYTSGQSMGTPVEYDSAISGKSGDLLKTDSGIGYTTILNSNNTISIYEGTLQGNYSLSYTSTFTVNSTSDTIQSLMFGNVFAFGIGYFSGDANKVFLINSSSTRTDHFIGVSPANITQGQRFSVDIALPMITLPREYPPGTFYYYGPYKYQVITPTQAVIIIESTIMQSSQV